MSTTTKEYDSSQREKNWVLDSNLKGTQTTELVQAFPPLATEKSLLERLPSPGASLDPLCKVTLEGASKVTGICWGGEGEEEKATPDK